MRVLIVGGSGYLGQFLLKHLLESPEDDVIAVGYTYADETTGSIDHPVTKNRSVPSLSRGRGDWGGDGRLRECYGAA